MRKGIDGLAYIANEKFHINPFESNLFLFCGRRRKFFKALSWEGTDFHCITADLTEKGLR
jgi:transposase